MIFYDLGPLSPKPAHADIVQALLKQSCRSWAKGIDAIAAARERRLPRNVHALVTFAKTGKPYALHLTCRHYDKMPSPGAWLDIPKHVVTRRARTVYKCAHGILWAVTAAVAEENRVWFLGWLNNTEAANMGGITTQIYRLWSPLHLSQRLECDKAII
jgi:hypothetical protein